MKKKCLLCGATVGLMLFMSIGSMLLKREKGLSGLTPVLLLGLVALLVVTAILFLWYCRLCDKETIFYRIVETDETITIVWNSITTKLPMILMAAALLLSALTQKFPLISALVSLVFVVLVVSGVLYALQCPQIRRKTEQAIDACLVESITGSEYSLKHPLTVVIRK